MQTPDATLHGFVLDLLSDASSRAAFDADPLHALSAAGLPDVTPQDVLDAIPLVMDFASSSTDGFDLGGHAWGNLADAEGGGRFLAISPLGSGAGEAVVSTDGVASAAWVDSGQGNVQADMTAGLDGVTSHGTFESPLGSGDWGFHAGPDGFNGRFQLSGLDSDTIGKGGDLVTGTVAGFVTDGADSLTGMLTDGAAALSQNLNAGSETLGGLTSDGAGMLSETLQDPTALQVPGLEGVGLPDVTQGLPLDVPALPALPAAPGLPALPDLGDLPVLGDLGHGLPNLPVELPQLPVNLPVDLPDVTQNLPAVPQLPSLPGVDAVHDTVAGVTSNVPLVGDLTDGLTDHLGLLGH